MRHSCLISAFILGLILPSVAVSANAQRCQHSMGIAKAGGSVTAAGSAVAVKPQPATVTLPSSHGASSHGLTGIDRDTLEIFQTTFKDDILEVVLGEGQHRQNAMINNHYSKVNPTRIQVLTALGRDAQKFTGKRHVITDAIFVLTNTIDPGLLGRATPDVSRSGKTRLQVEIPIHPSWIEGDNLYKNAKLLQGLARSAFIGDKAIQPHIVKNEKTKVRYPSLVQRENLDLLTEELIKSSKDDLSLTPGTKGLPTRPIRVATQTPGGGGKTFMAARFLKQHAKFTAADGSIRNYIPEVIFVIVNDRGILKDAVKAYGPEFDLHENEQQNDIARFYGGTKINPAVLNQKIPERLKGKKLVLITRRALFTRLDDFMDWAKDNKVAFVIDEAHHVNEGTQEFPAIVAAINALPQDPNDPNHLMLMISATMHNNGNLITDPQTLGYRDPAFAGTGKIVGPYMEERLDLPPEQRPPDLAQLQRGENVPGIAIYQYNQAVIHGYAKPSREIQVITPENRDRERTLATVVKSPSTDKDEVHINWDNLRDMWSRMKGSRRKYEFHRGLIKVDRTIIADAVKVALETLHQEDIEAGENDDAMFMSLHSSAGDEDDLLEKIRDTQAQQHRYLIVVDMANEGIDIPSLNLVVIYANVGDTEGGLRLVYQIVVRAGRPSELSTSNTILDWSGMARRLDGNVGRLRRGRVSGGGGNGRPKPMDVVLTDDDLDIQEAFIPTIPTMSLPVSGRLNIALDWLRAHHPFISADNGVQEGLASAILHTIALLPLTDYSNGSFNFKLDDPALLAKIANEKVRNLMITYASTLVNDYNELLNVYLEVQRVEDDLVQEVSGPKHDELLKDKALYMEMVADCWERLRSTFLLFDAHRGKGASIRISGAGKTKLQAPLLADFYGQAVDALQAKFGPKAIKLSGRYNDDEIEITVEGDSAYALLREESGKHKIKVTKGGKAFTLELNVHVESRPKDEHTFNSSVISPGYRRVYNGTGSRHFIKDEASKLTAEMARAIEDTETQMELRSLDNITRMFEYNSDVYTLDVIQDQVQPHLTDLFDDQVSGTGGE